MANTKKEIIPVPNRLIIHSEEELCQKIDEADEDFRLGRTVDAEEAIIGLSEKYC